MLHVHTLTPKRARFQAHKFLIFALILTIVALLVVSLMSTELDMSEIQATLEDHGTEARSVISYQTARPTPASDPVLTATPTPAVAVVAEVPTCEEPKVDVKMKARIAELEDALIKAQNMPDNIPPLSQVALDADT